MADDSRRLIVVSGLSGAGKSIALNSLEDLGFYCIDNLPLSLLREFIDQVADPDTTLSKQLAVGIDARDPAYDFSKVSDSVNKLNDNNISTELIYIEASDDVLTQRFSETRRKHPLSSRQISLADAIKKERGLLQPLSDCSDIRIDTSHTSFHELRDIVRSRIARLDKQELSLQFLSFGYKHGLPRDADFIFDVRCLPNPHWEKELRNLTGFEQPVIDFLEQQELVLQMQRDIIKFLERWIAHFEADNRSYLSIAIGCTGGHHRSVYMVDRISEHFLRQNNPVIIRHRDI